MFPVQFPRRLCGTVRMVLTTHEIKDRSLMA
jgi:hypothetical protein